MVIKAVNFGEVLISRPAGREAFMAAQAYVFPKDGIADNQVTLDFEGVKVLAPSWADEFIKWGYLLRNLCKFVKISQWH